MSSIDTSSWKEFKLDDILQKVNTAKVPLKKGDCPVVATDKYTIPARTATTSNQGLSCYVPTDMCTVLNHKISVSANGDFCAFWHDSDFTILQDAYALEGKGFELTENVALFLISVMMHSFSEKYNWNNKSGWEKLRNEVISLPVKETEEIDWEYMQERISELEQERISELEQERISELEQYLIATGLNDYELTDEDREILATKLIDGGASESSISGSGCWKEAREFRLSEIFGKPIRGTRLVKERRVAGEIPLVTAGFNNQGVAEFISNGEQETFSGGITIDMFGNCFYRNYEFKADDNILIFDSKEISERAKLFVASSVNKTTNGLYSYGRQYRMKSYNDTVVILPVTSSGTPDWPFMEKYIRAIEKVTIADVVKYKDEIIQKTKEAVA